LKGPSLYAFKGLAGRLAPVGVHIALLLVMAGGTVSAAGSFRGSVTVPQGLNFVVGDVLVPSGFLSSPTEAFNTEIHVNRFYMDYYESGEVKEIFVFYEIVIMILEIAIELLFMKYQPEKVSKMLILGLCYRFHSSTLIFPFVTWMGKK